MPSSVAAAVLKPSDAMPEGSQKVEELDFNNFAGKSITVEDMVAGMGNMGFQASSIGTAVKIINDMVAFSHLHHCCLVADIYREHGENQSPAQRLPYF